MMEDIPEQTMVIGEFKIEKYDDGEKVVVSRKWAFLERISEQVICGGDFETLMSVLWINPERIDRVAKTN